MIWNSIKITLSGLFLLQTAKVVFLQRKVSLEIVNFSMQEKQSTGQNIFSMHKNRTSGKKFSPCNKNNPQDKTYFSMQKKELSEKMFSPCTKNICREKTRFLYIEKAYTKRKNYLYIEKWYSQRNPISLCIKNSISDKKMVKKPEIFYLSARYICMEKINIKRWENEEKIRNKSRKSRKVFL